MLISLAKAAFKHAGWPTTIRTGRQMFPLGDNCRNVASVEEAGTADDGGCYDKTKL